MVKLLVALFSELLNILVLEHKACFKILSPYLFLRTSAIDCFDGKQSFVRNINTKDITNSITSYRAI